MKLRWENIKTIVSDFDGVMTDNRVLVDSDGKESVFVSRADGQAIHILRSMGIDLVIMSSEANKVVKKRAEKMQVQCIQSVLNKAECLKEYCSEKGILPQDVAYIGNDVNDLEAMRLVGFKIVPNDAYGEVKSIADYITEVRGGQGVIREIASIIKSNKA